MYKTMSVFYLHFLQSNTFLSCVILIAISEHFCASGLSDSVAFRSVPLCCIVFPQISTGLEDPIAKVVLKQCI